MDFGYSSSSLYPSTPPPSPVPSAAENAIKTKTRPATAILPTALRSGEALTYPIQSSLFITTNGQLVVIRFRNLQISFESFFNQSGLTAEEREHRGRLLPVIFSATQSCFLTGNISAEWNPFLKSTEVYIRLDNDQYRWRSSTIHVLLTGWAYCTLELEFGIWDGNLTNRRINIALIRDSSSKWIPEDKRWSTIAMESRLEQHPFIQSIPSEGNLKVALKDNGECFIKGYNSPKFRLATPVHMITVYSG